MYLTSRRIAITITSMLWNRIRQVIYAALTAIGFVWTNYYLVQFIIITKGELTLANFLNFDIALFIKQIYAYPASSFIGIDVTVAALCAIVVIVTEGRRLKMRLWGLYLKCRKKAPAIISDLAVR
ncbi:MAG: DUF2834 domain-containing protein [Moorea sp. SIO2I5]|nr:DUF2834 domain-containing protein [Moorena sp. SIO2I5]